MPKPPTLPLSGVLLALLAATALNLACAMLLPPGPRGAAVALLTVAKVLLVVYGFMRLRRHSAAMAGFLVAYAVLLSALAGARIAFAG